MTLIYVEVLDVPDGQLWPVQAELVHGSCYRLLGSSPDPEHMPWSFTEGQVVRCRTHLFAENEPGLIAVEPCSCL